MKVYRKLMPYDNIANIGYGSNAYVVGLTNELRNKHNVSYGNDLKEILSKETVEYLGEINSGITKGSLIDIESHVADEYKEKKGIAAFATIENDCKKYTIRYFLEQFYGSATNFFSDGKTYTMALIFRQLNTPFPKKMDISKYFDFNSSIRNDNSLYDKSLYQGGGNDLCVLMVDNKDLTDKFYKHMMRSKLGFESTNDRDYMFHYLLGNECLSLTDVTYNSNNFKNKIEKDKIKKHAISIIFDNIQNSDLDTVIINQTIKRNNDGNGTYTHYYSFYNENKEKEKKGFLPIESKYEYEYRYKTFGTGGETKEGNLDRSIDIRKEHVFFNKKLVLNFLENYIIENSITIENSEFYEISNTFSLKEKPDSLILLKGEILGRYYKKYYEDIGTTTQDQYRQMITPKIKENCYILDMLNLNNFISNKEPGNFIGSWAEAPAEADKISNLVDTLNENRKFKIQYTGVSGCPWKDLINDRTPQTHMFNIDKYYDTYSGMTPYIQVKFRTGENSWKEYNTVDDPYIVSLNVSDKGVKTISLNLLDKDFSSCYLNVDNDLKRKGETDPYKLISEKSTLEEVVRNSLKYTMTVENTDSEDERKKRVQLSNEEASNKGKENITVEEAAWSFDKLNKQTTMPNLKIRFGYIDYNPTINSLSDDYLGYKNWKDTKRTNKYWDMMDGQSENAKIEGKVQMPSSYGENDSASFSGEWKDVNLNHAGTDTIIKREIQICADEKYVADYSDQTTAMSREQEYIITGYKTNIGTNGLSIAVSAIEFTEMRSINASIVQRNSKFEGTPVEVLNCLYRLFNLKKSSPVRLFWGDEDDIYEEIDPSTYKNGEAIPTEVKRGNTDALTSVYEGDNEEAFTSPTHIKKISIALGDEDAAYNYSYGNVKEGRAQLTYKSIANIINDFCNACPPLKGNTIKVNNPSLKDYEGNTQQIKSEENLPRKKLTWFSMPITEDDGKTKTTKTAIILHYEKLNKICAMREYDWGFGVANTAVKSVSIENPNEFAVLSGMSYYDAQAKSIKALDNNNDGTVSYTEVDGKEVNGNGGQFFCQRGSTSTIAADAFQLAMANSMYKGNMTIMGDPFFDFDAYMRPYSYPIYLNIILPNSVTQRQYEGNQDLSDKTTTPTSVHHLSGVYVVGEITHNISTGGFNTQLNVMSYPGLEIMTGIQGVEEVNAMFDAQEKTRQAEAADRKARKEERAKNRAENQEALRKMMDNYVEDDVLGSTDNPTNYASLKYNLSTNTNYQETNIDPNFKKYSCYFLSLVFCGTGQNISQMTTTKINSITAACKKKGYITSDFTVTNPVGVLNYVSEFYGNKEKFEISANRSTYDTSCKYHIAHWKDTQFEHFITFSDSKTVIFDSLGLKGSAADNPQNPTSNTVHNGKFESWRQFRVKK